MNQVHQLLNKMAKKDKIVQKLTKMLKTFEKENRQLRRTINILEPRLAKKRKIQS